MHFHGSQQQPPDNILLEEIERASQSNSAIHYQERLVMTLNDAAHISQDIDFEEKMARYHLDYRNSSDAVKARMH